MYILYAIPNCDTVKKARVWLAQHGVDYQFHDYKKQGIDRATLHRWLSQKPWPELLNRTGTTWRRLPETDKPTDAEGAVALMMAQPSVIRRPLIEADGQIVALGFTPDNYATVLGQ